MRRQRVDAAALVNAIAVHVGVVPCALRDAHRAGNHARRDFRQDLDFAERVLHADLVALLDAALFSVGGVDPRLLRVHFLEQLDAAPRGVRATAIVEAAAAQGELVGGHVSLGETVRVHGMGEMRSSSPSSQVEAMPASVSE